MVLKHFNKQIFFSAYITNKYTFIFDNSQPFPGFTTVLLLENYAISFIELSYPISPLMFEEKTCLFLQIWHNKNKPDSITEYFRLDLFFALNRSLSQHASTQFVCPFQQTSSRFRKTFGFLTKILQLEYKNSCL